MISRRLFCGSVPVISLTRDALRVRSDVTTCATAGPRTIYYSSIKSR